MEMELLQNADGKYMGRPFRILRYNLHTGLHGEYIIIKSFPGFENRIIFDTDGKEFKLLQNRSSIILQYEQCPICAVMSMTSFQETEQFFLH